jgi:hypothetical protein
MFGFEYTGARAISRRCGSRASISRSTSTRTIRSPLAHYAFKVSEEEFDLIFKRSSRRICPTAVDVRVGGHADQSLERRAAACIFRDPSGHLLEILTRDYTPDMFK